MGIRPGTKLSDSHRKAISQGLRKAIENGWKPNTSSWAVGLSSITPESRKLGSKRAAETMSGRPQRLDTVCGKHKDNKNAKWWKFENKSMGKVLEGKNLNQLIRDNAELFDPLDLKWDVGSCNAARGLRNLKKKNKPPNSWKGWVIRNPDKNDL